LELIFLCTSSKQATGWMGIHSPAGARLTLPVQTPWGPLSILYDGYQVSFPGVKWPGHGVDHSPPCSAEVRKRVELYIYCCYGPAGPVPGWRASIGQIPLLLNYDGVVNKGVAFGLNILNSRSQHYLHLPHSLHFTVYIPVVVSLILSVSWSLIWHSERNFCLSNFFLLHS
jgi:hypothetical protein